LSALIESGILTRDQAAEAGKVLKDKCRVYGNGCLKRGKKDEGEYYLNLCRGL
jgi:hypothetical protein